ncbi:hypothetical protein Neosp_004151 [[Neocosmospora] mangrovei]
MIRAIKGSQPWTELDDESIVTAGQVVKLVSVNFPNDWWDAPSETINGRMSSVEEHVSEKASYSQYG